MPRACESALPAAVFDAAEVRPSRRTLDAALAAAREVDSRGLCACVKALAAAVFDALPVLDEFNTFAAALAALGPVVFVAIVVFPYVGRVGGDGMPPPGLHQQRTKKLHAS